MGATGFRHKPYDGAAAEHAVAADRFAREIVSILRSSYAALAAAERQSVGPLNHSSYFSHSFLTFTNSPGILLVQLYTLGAPYAFGR